MVSVHWLQLKGRLLAPRPFKAVLEPALNPGALAGGARRAAQMNFRLQVFGENDFFFIHLCTKHD